VTTSVGVEINIQELVRAMRMLLSNPALAREMGTTSALRIQAFTPEACAEGFSKAVAFACDGTE
jgi:glycosyltransferase involved in cell wall biosynthesis